MIIEIIFGGMIICLCAVAIIAVTLMMVLIGTDIYDELKKRFKKKHRDPW